MLKQKRKTKQFEIIRSLITNAGRPLSIDELEISASKVIDSISTRTIYRAIRRLEEMCEIQSIEVPGRANRYELSSIASNHHHHFHCTVCDRLFDIHGCPDGIANLSPRGFSMSSHDLLLNGKCDSC